jgi:TolB-like protein/class 3 adenylate cyclase/Tfp pilus assembly protein PilF
MSAETKSDRQLEIAHVLFIDIVGYSKLLMNEQSEVLQQLNQIVRNTEQFRKAEAAGKLIRIPVGDGMALVFFDSPETPVRAAVEISEALQNYPQIQLRMGIHSGPVNKELDVNDRSNVAGTGINMAQRVMECGDAGHILLSKRVADDLAPFGHWRPQLHDLGDCEVKHGERVFLVNFYNEKIGNRQLPEKLKHARQIPAGSAVADSVPAIRKQRPIPLVPFVLAGLAVAVVVLFFLYRTASKQSISTSPGAAAGTSIPEKSIAVLPFENLSKDEENAFFAGGVQDEILTNLAKIADLKVISRTSVMKYKGGPERNLRGIAKALGVAHVVEGSVQRASGRVRINAQLIDARTDTHLWADHYDRDIADVFAIQSEIAQRIADQLRAKLSPQEKAALASKPTQDTEAYDLYLRAKELMHSVPPSEPASVEKLSSAVNLLDKAVAHDPNFALAYCLLVEANLSLHWGESAPGARERAEVALQAARRLAPEAAETHLAEGLFFYWGKRDYDHALESLEKAARLSPNSVDVFRYSAWVERRLGRWAEAIRHELRAAELDPRDWHPRDEAISNYILVRDYPAAEGLADRAIADFPERADYFRAIKAEAAFYRGDLKTARASLATLSAPEAGFHWQLWNTALWERNYAEAERLLSVWAQRHEPDDTLFPRSFLQALTARAAGQSERARSAFSSAQQHYAALLGNRNEQPRLLSQLAIVDAALGRKEEALQEGRRAVELLPISRDAVFGPELVRNLALTYCWIGERDRAIEQLSSVASLPNGPSYGELKFDPQWDELRGDPRFEKIVASLAPKP